MAVTAILTHYHGADRVVQRRRAQPIVDPAPLSIIAGESGHTQRTDRASANESVRPHTPFCWPDHMHTVNAAQMATNIARGLYMFPDVPASIVPELVADPPGSVRRAAGLPQPAAHNANRRPCRRIRRVTACTFAPSLGVTATWLVCASRDPVWILSCRRQWPTVHPGNSPQQCVAAVGTRQTLWMSHRRRRRAARLSLASWLKRRRSQRRL